MEVKIAEYINEIINNGLALEESLGDANLYFNIEEFSLYQNIKSKEIYLSEMGSGSNWLNCHIALMLGLHKYIALNNSKIPSFIFFDQPSQVYFPTSIKDENAEFNIDDIEAKKGTNTKDEDLNAVTNLFNQLVTFCKTTFEETGIEPQIIVTDHADNLKLDKIEFEKLVNGRRWRTRGFIE